MKQSVKIERFTRYAWSVLLYVFAVVAWGAFVRASFSGDGCGSHWPLCDGEVLPTAPSIEKLIEFSHRLSSGLLLPLIIGLVVWARRLFPKGHSVRQAAWTALGFTLLEALIGAALVRFGWVAEDDRVSRAGMMAFHVISTYFLVSSIAVAAFAAKTDRRLEFRNQGPLLWALVFGMFLLVVLGVSGAISALGHMLKPTENVLQAALQADTHWMVRFQPLHPLLATSIGLYLTLIGGLAIHLRPDPAVKRAVKTMVTVYGLQIGVGLVSILLKAPIPMQMLHLVLADVMTISLVATAYYALLEGVPRREMQFAPVETGPALRGRELVGQYLVLTKPRVISLLLFTTLTAMFTAARGWPGLGLFVAVALGGYMAAGAANAINMVVDRDIDGAMRRTSKRPTVTQRISSAHALRFSFALAAASFALLWWAANLLCAMLALAGLVFYVCVYTLGLKRRTWHNIVIGGAAGAFPPLVGWSAVTGELTPLAWCLFAIIFLWTPVHFWALALLIQDDYEKAGVPMAPVVLGERLTVIQIVLYAVLTAVVSALPLVQKAVGWPYVASALILNAILLIRSVQLYFHTDRPRALSLYKYSMLYLALLFLMLAIDQSVSTGPRREGAETAPRAWVYWGIDPTHRAEHSASGDARTAEQDGKGIGKKGMEWLSGSDI